MNKKSITYLQLEARSVRRDILTMSYFAKSAHSGGAYSAVEILVSLYFDVMRVFPKNAEDPRRDRLIFSKAHDAKALYAVLARRGYFPRKILEKYEVNDGVLPGHSTRHCVPGVEVSAGALGHGLSMAAGMAWALKNKLTNLPIYQLTNKRKNSLPTTYNLQPTTCPRVYAVLSDGECDEGSTWEAALFAGHHKLDNLTVIIDYNKLQGYGFTKDILDPEPFAAKWKAFRFAVHEVDGHSLAELHKTLSSVPFEKGKPSVVIAHTIKGLGGPKQHVGRISSQYKPPTEEEYRELVNSE